MITKSISQGFASRSVFPGWSHMPGTGRQECVLIQVTQEPRLTDTLPCEMSSITWQEKIDNQVKMLLQRNDAYNFFSHISLSRARHPGDKEIQFSHMFRREATGYQWTVVMSIIAVNQMWYMEKMGESKITARFWPEPPEPLGKYWCIYWEIW